MAVIERGDRISTAGDIPLVPRSVHTVRLLFLEEMLDTYTRAKSQSTLGDAPGMADESS